MIVPFSTWRVQEKKKSTALKAIIHEYFECWRMILRKNLNSGNFMKKPTVWGTYGGLGPDLENDQVINKRAMKSKVGDFSDQLRQINRETILKSMNNSCLHDPRQKEISRREKANQFARSISKPPKRTLKQSSPHSHPLSTARDRQLDHITTLLHRYEELAKEVNKIKLRYSKWCPFIRVHSPFISQFQWNLLFGFIR